jgi:geranylgeranyl diphosphate synthase type I
MTDPRQLDARLESLSEEVERWTQQFFRHFQPSADRFRAMLGYPLGWFDDQLRPLEPPGPAGKRLRPALCLLICEAVGGSYRQALGPASAVELIHNFSLVHDDIQDQSDLRRGRPTVWASFGAAQALNVGDSLFALAQLALVHEPAAEPALQVEAVSLLNRTCLRLVEGQFRDLDLQVRGGASLEAYQTMVAGKTAALLECAAWLGARYGGAELARAERFAAFARELGLAFQYQDDLLGLWGDPALTGKSAETDLLSRKQALPAVLALQADGPAADRFRALFSGSEPISPAAARELLQQLERLEIRPQAERLVESGYQRAAAVLGEALADEPGELLWLLLERFRSRQA